MYPIAVNNNGILCYYDTSTDKYVPVASLQNQ